MAEPVVRLERFPDEQIAVLTFDRPPLNAIDEQVVTELAEATAELAADTRHRAPCSSAARSTASSWPGPTSTSSSA